MLVDGLIKFINSILIWLMCLFGRHHQPIIEKSSQSSTVFQYLLYLYCSIKNVASEKRTSFWKLVYFTSLLCKKMFLFGVSPTSQLPLELVYTFDKGVRFITKLTPKAFKARLTGFLSSQVYLLPLSNNVGSRDGCGVCANSGHLPSGLERASEITRLGSE